MMKVVIVAAAMGLFLTGCGPDSPAQVERERRMASGEALFTQEGTYKNCKTGYMQWRSTTPSVTDRFVYSVICDTVPSVSLEYQSGKTTTNEVVIGAPQETPEQLAAKAAAIAKAEGLKKLTDEEKKALGL